MLILFLSGLIIAALFVTFICTRKFALMPERDPAPPPPPAPPVRRAAAVESVQLDPPIPLDYPHDDAHAKWIRDMAANQRVHGWAERERGFEKYIEDIKAGRRQ
ncbi:hypothetical protein ACVWZM_005273 [Bradyrhizobium sp. USDA 4501]